MGRVWPLLGLLLAVFALGAHSLEYPVTEAVCFLKPTTVGSQTFSVSGQLTFTASGANVDVSFDVSGLSVGSHEFAVHRHGDLQGLDASSVRSKLYSFDTINITQEGTSISGSFGQVALALDGADSIIGRSVVVYGNGDDVTTPVAFCVIGRKTEATTATAAADRSSVTRAVCHLTGKAGTSVSGFLEFEKVASGVDVRLIAYGLSEGDHGMHVHLKGDISDPDGLATAGHFLEGDITGLPAGRTEIGQLGPTADNAYPSGWKAGQTFSVKSKDDVTRVFFNDPFITLSGINSIIGRSVVIHDSPDASVRVAQCVIGIASEQAYVDPPVMNPDVVGVVPQVTAASAIITGYGARKINGYVNFEVVGENDLGGATAGHVRIRYYVAGLTPGNHGWHVHLFGDDDSSDVLATSGHFIGTNPSRPPGQLPEIGLLADGAPMVADANGVAQGEVVDTQIRLNGVNSIVGRSVVIHDNDTDKTRMARGVIGRTRESATQLEPESTTITKAVCHLRPTVFGTSGTIGVIHFEAINNGVKVTYDVSGLPSNSGASPNNHGWHIHRLGDISGDAGLSTSGHFIGCPAGVRPEVGQLGQTGSTAAPLVLDSGAAADTFNDTLLRLNGVNSIVGRSLIIHGSSDYNTDVRVAMCVIGLTEEAIVVPENTNRPKDDVPFVSTARCDLRPTTTSPFPNLKGYFEFTQQTPESNLINVEYMITGLDLSDHYFHVHQYGDLFTPNGKSVLDHYIGTVDAGSGRIEVGQLNLDPLQSDNGDFIGTFNDVNNAKLNYMNNIVGRSMIVHGDGVDPLARVAQCVIGITAESAAVNVLQLERTEEVKRAICNFEATTHNAGPLSGYIQFEYDSKYNLISRLWVQGLSPGDHTFHVHQLGDISKADGSGTLGHFQGLPESRLEVGQLGGATYKITADANGFASAYFVDTEAKLSGRNSIIGRSIIIHGNAANSGAKVAQCVIGIMMEDDDLPISNTTHGTVPLVTQAAAVLAPTSAGPAALKGQVEFFEMEENDLRLNVGSRMRYIVTGLSPNTNYTWSINQYGDSGTSGSTFKGCANRTVAGAETEVGALGEVYPMKSDANGVARAEIVDRFMSLNGLSSVIGRTLVVYGKNGGGATVAFATGVIGRRHEIAAVKAAPPAVATEAICRLQSTGKSSTAISGTVTFTQVSPSSDVIVDYNINGFSAPGKYPWHVHQWGDLLGYSDALSTSGHFIGSRFLRDQCALQEVGNINDGTPLDVGTTSAVGTFSDDVLELSGPNSIIGRSIVIHDAANSANRIAYCVIGVTNEDSFDPEACLDELSFTVPERPANGEGDGDIGPTPSPCLDGTYREVCPTPPPQKSSSDDVPLIVGLTVGLGGGLLVIGTIAFFFMKSRGATLSRSKEIAGAEMQRV